MPGTARKKGKKEEKKKPLRGKKVRSDRSHSFGGGALEGGNAEFLNGGLGETYLSLHLGKLGRSRSAVKKGTSSKKTQNEKSAREMQRRDQVYFLGPKEGITKDKKKGRGAPFIFAKTGGRGKAGPGGGENDPGILPRGAKGRTRGNVFKKKAILGLLKVLFWEGSSDSRLCYREKFLSENSPRGGGGFAGGAGFHRGGVPKKNASPAQETSRSAANGKVQSGARKRVHH